MVCQCPQCSQTPSPTWSREHAIQCEARWLASLSLTQRRTHLTAPAVQGRRADLEQQLTTIWRQR